MFWVRSTDIVKNSGARSHTGRYPSFVTGLIESLPIVAGYVPVAITFGLLARTNGLTAADSVLSSCIVFAGAAQFMAVGLFAQQTALVNVAVATFLLNFRHLFMSTVMTSRLTAPRTPFRPVLAFGVTDEVFAVASNRDALPPRYVLGVQVGAYAAWVAGTAVGALAGSVLPETIRAAFGIALFALFTAIVAIQIVEDRSLIVPTVLAGGLNWFLRGGLGMSAGTAFPIALLGGAAIGYALVSRFGPAGENGKPS